MLYLEDYLELIEHLPQELRDRFTDIRERDLQVHNSSEQLKERVQHFFAEAKELSPEQRQCKFQKLLDDYQDTMKYADIKVQVATQTHKIMIKLMQRLDTELEKFKLELEADHAGITEELERRSFELDADSRFDDLINGHLTSNNNNHHQTSINHLPHNHHHSVSSASKYNNHGIKDGRRSSEHKIAARHRHHPYQNNHTPNNGYHGRAKSSNNHDHYIPTKHPQQSQRHGSKYDPNRLQQTSPALSDSVFSTSAPPSVIGDLSRIDPGEYGSYLSSINSGFKNSINGNKNNLQYQYPNSQSSHPHSALSAALASNTSQMNSVSALAMTNATSVHNKISNIKGSDLNDPNSTLIRQNPLAAAASQAIAATQQLHQGRRTPSLKASFAAINAAGLAPTDGIGSNSKHDNSSGNNRNALAPMAPDQQAFRYNQYGKISNSSTANSCPLYVSVTTKSGRPTKRPKYHASHLYPDESPTSISSDNSVFENSESLSSNDYIDNGTAFGSTSPSPLDFAANVAQGNGNLYHRDDTIYCICRQVSYGEMVACDSKECEIEWFHYGCVGVTQPPKGKWYCPNCTRRMAGQQNSHSQPQTHKKRGRKEKSLFNLSNNSAVDIVRSKDRGCEQSKNIA